MNNLSNTIRAYFVEHFAELPLDKQFHFASRLWFWQQDETARSLLDELRPAMLPTGDVIDSLRQIGSGQLLPLRPGSQNVLSLRAPFFARYPGLRRAATILYYGLMLDACYGTNARERLSEILPPDELKALHDDLMNDPPALAMLSTHAVNFIYLYHRYVQQAENLPAVRTFTTLAGNPQIYDLADPLQTQLRIYLLTHTIIGESMFYQSPIPADMLAAYQSVMLLLEAIISENLSAINLDNKLEFLVCSRLTAYKTELEQQLLQEAAASVSDHGSYLVDRHNANPQTLYTTFDKSEHRNLLYLLATTQRDAK